MIKRDPSGFVGSVGSNILSIEWSLALLSQLKLAAQTKVGEISAGSRQIMCEEFLRSETCYNCRRLAA